MFPTTIGFLNFGERDLIPIVDIEQRLLRQNVRIEIDDTWVDDRFWDLDRVRTREHRIAVLKAVNEIEDMGFDIYHGFSKEDRRPPITSTDEFAFRRPRPLRQAKVAVRQHRRRR
jgi:hypothetical protein